jgi:signal transduction histidine kinase
MPLTELRTDLRQDVENILKIDIIPSLLDVVCRSTGMGFAAVARVTENNWVACQVQDEIGFGLQPGGELVVETTICHEVRQQHHLVVFDDAEKDPVYNTHHTPRQYGIKSYISVPITKKNGDFFGTLCAIDPRPAQVNNPKIIGMFTLFAELIAFHLDAIESLEIAESRLAEERRIAESKDQLLAILGHDLRNPLGAIVLANESLQASDLKKDFAGMTDLISRSSRRMVNLINNIMDFAQGKLGSGIQLSCAEEHQLEGKINQVLTEFKLLAPFQLIETEINITQPVYCDAERIAQVFSNLLGNAIAYCKPGSTIGVFMTTANKQLNLTVVNETEHIHGIQLERLFQPFYREEKSNKKGLGLGLYISSEIAKAHKGILEVKLEGDKINFSITLPSNPASDCV